MVVGLEEQASYKAKMRSNDRVFILGPIDGKKPLNTAGMVDSRLFTGENRLHAILNEQNSMWSLKYDSGILPLPFRQYFTSFGKAERQVRDYYAKRNVEIKQIID